MAYDFEKKKNEMQPAEQQPFEFISFSWIKFNVTM